MGGVDTLCYVKISIYDYRTTILKSVHKSLEKSQIFWPKIEPRSHKIILVKKGVTRILSVIKGAFQNKSIPFERV